MTRQATLVVPAFLSFGILSLGIAGACANSRASGSGPADGGPLDAGRADVAAPEGDTGVNLVGDGAVGCQDQCSADLHSVLDCQGNVKQTCPPDEGCAGSACVPACASATANQSAVGCEYYSLNPTSFDTLNDTTNCFAAFIANTWTTPVTIEVERGGTMFDATTIAFVPHGSGASITYAPVPATGLPSGEVAVVFLADGADPHRSSPCPAGVGVAAAGPGAQVWDTGFGQAFHITTSAPVSAYDIYPYGGGASAITSATLLWPTASWDKNYLVLSETISAQKFGPLFYVTAAEDDTQVTLLPNVALASGDAGFPSAEAGTPVTYSLSKGQFLVVSQSAELTGSPLEATKPVGVWGGCVCLYLPAGAPPCDTTHQQVPPIRAMGSRYVAVRYRNRFPGYEEAPPWRLVGAVDGTTLTFDPPQPGAPATLDLGQVAEFPSTGPFVVSSQDDAHPFYFAAYMTGCESNCVAAGQTNCSSDCRGDPEVVNVVPAAQYMQSYVFFTDPTYPETNLVVTRARGPKGFADVTVDCAGTLSGWAPIGTSGEYEYTRLDLATGNFAPVGACNNGRHQATSDGTFSLTVWGWGSGVTGGAAPGMASAPGFYTQAVSYAYPAGASVKPINQVQVPPVPK